MVDSAKDKVISRWLGVQPYVPVWHAMQSFTETRTAQTPDEIWWLEHAPVFTQGQAGKAEHILHAGDIPVVQVDRGGQVTYHGPGQLVGYLLIDIERLGLNVRQLVDHIEQSLVETLSTYAVDAHPRKDAPGVYVGEAKIASLGLRVRKGGTFHGLALNLDMDLAPFQQINPCGHAGMPMTQLKHWAPEASMSQVQQILCKSLVQRLGYRHTEQTRVLAESIRAAVLMNKADE